MKALINKINREVVDVASASFPVHPSLVWVDAPDGVTAGCIYKDGQFIPPEAPKPTRKPSLLSRLVSSLSKDRR